MSLFDSDDDATYGDISKKFVRLKRVERNTIFAPTLPALPTTAFNADTSSFLRHLNVMKEQIIANTLNSPQGPRKTKSKSNVASQSKRRRKAKNNNNPDNIGEYHPRSEGRPQANANRRQTTRENSRTTENTRSSARIRGRGEGGRGRCCDIPTYNIGNTEEYDDVLENVPLFSQPSTTDVIEIKDSSTDVICLDDSTTEINEVLSVKVDWKCMEVFKFDLRRYQKFKEVFDFFAKKENVSADKVLLTYNDKIIFSDDTPDSIDYNIARLIDGGIIEDSVSLLRDKPQTKATGIKIKFQSEKIKKPFETYVQRDEKLSVAMIKCAEHLDVPLQRLKFEFDGDIIKGSETVHSLDIEIEACIDVKIKN